MIKFFLPVAGLLGIALFIAVKYSLAVNAELAETKFEKILVERKVSSLNKQRQTWDNARDSLRAEAERRRAEFNDLQGKYNALNDTDKDFLDNPVPDGVVVVLRESERTALRNYLVAAERFDGTDPAPETWRALTTRDVFNNREAYVEALSSCNADKKAIRDGFEQAKKSPANSPG